MIGLGVAPVILSPAIVPVQHPAPPDYQVNTLENVLYGRAIRREGFALP